MTGVLIRTEVEELVSEYRVEHYAGGMTVVREGDRGDYVYVVVDGVVELRRSIAGRTVTLQLMRAGAVFGDAPVLLGRPEPFDAYAVTDTAMVTIPATELFPLLNRRPHLARRWLETYAARIADTQARVSDLLSGTLDAQVASYLLRTADSDELEISQERLAQLFGVRRTSLNQVLRRMEIRGLVELTYRRITIRNRGGLEALLA